MENTTSTKDLKRVLGFRDLLLTAIGQIIGGGIVSLTGIAIARAGHAVPVAFITSALLVVLMTIPRVLLCGTVRMRGGEYTMIGLLAGEKFSGVFILLHICQNISLAMYAISFADYCLAFIPGLNIKLVAFAVLTLFYVLNLFGIDKMAKAQNIIVSLMCTAFVIFCVFGLGKVDFFHFAPQTIFAHGGFKGMMSAAVLLIYATSGASSMMNLSAEAKNPVRDLPLVMIISTFLVAVLYGIIGIVASGILPISEVANQSLRLVAEEILSGPLYTFFIVFGCMFALISTLNSQFAWAPKPVLQACVDGWLPKKLGAVNSKYKTPHWLLTILYIVGLLTIFFGLNLDIIASITIVINQLMYLLVNVNIIRLPNLLPEQWKNSKFKVSDGALKVIMLISVLTCLVNIWLVCSGYSIWIYVANFGMFAVSYLFAANRYNSGKVNMEISIEDN